MSGEIRLYLLIRRTEPSESYVLICRTIAETREEWFRALRSSSSAAGFLHCGDARPDFAHVASFFRPGRIVITDSARQVLPDVLTPAFRMLGFLDSPVARRMKVFELTAGWRPVDVNHESTLVAAPRRPQPSVSVAHNKPPSRSFLQEVENLIEQRRERQRQVLRARLGTHAARTTLEEAGALVGITRERVRQLEARFLDDFRDAPVAADLLERIHALRVEASQPLQLSELAQREPWFRDLGAGADLLRVLLPVASDNSLKVIDIPIGSIVCSATVEAWTDVIRNVIDIIRNLPRGTTRAEVVEAIRQVMVSQNAPELLGHVVAAVEEQVHYSDDGALLGVGETQTVIVTTILRDAGRPLHYTEVAQRWSSRVGEPIDPLAAHRALQRSPGVRLLGRGTYGLDEHIGVTAEAMEAIVTDCEFIMTNARLSRQWHASELLAVLQDMRPDIPDAVDKYVLDACLSRSAALTSVGRLVWTLRDAGEGPTRRIDMRDAAVEVLRRVGHPLSDPQLRAEIRRARGLDRVYFFLVPTRELARIAPGVWGLVERDFGIDEQARREVVDELAALLRARGSALHSSEVRDALSHRIQLPNTLSGYMIQQLATIDPRLKLFQGELVGLADWTEPHRPTVRGAMQEIANALRADVTLDWLHRELERAVQRPITRQALYSIVAGSDLVYDADRRLWRRADADD